MPQEKQRHTVIPRTLIFVFKNNKLLLMKYSGKGHNPSKEKKDRKDIYNPIGGHVEKGENIIQSAIKEAQEEAGIKLVDPKIKGFIHTSNFAGKNVMMFLICATTKDDHVGKTLEGELEWVDPKNIDKLNLFPDLQIILKKLLKLKNNNMLVGTSKFDGGFGLKKISLETY